MYRVVGEWSQSNQRMLSAPLSCSVHNGNAIAVAQSVSSDGSSLVRAGYCPHTTVSDLLSTNVLVSPLGALVEAELEAIKYDYVSVHDIDTC